MPPVLSLVLPTITPEVGGPSGSLGLVEAGDPQGPSCPYAIILHDAQLAAARLQAACGFAEPDGGK
eukprot:1162028-Pelagomonas_calceolata.AAC.1